VTNVAGDPFVEVVQRQLTGSDLSLSDTVGQLAESDPQLGLLAQILTQRETQLHEEVERREFDELQRAEDARRLDELREQADSLRRHLQDMEAELEIVRSTLDDLADALGACPSCWGQFPECRWCRGLGRPGFMPPNPEGFNRLVMPAVRVQAHMRRHRHPYLDDDHEPGTEPSQTDTQLGSNDQDSRRGAPHERIR
jgi:hypothetical protein